jgi:hypothetical protein
VRTLIKLAVVALAAFGLIATFQLGLVERIATVLVAVLVFEVWDNAN